MDFGLGGLIREGAGRTRSRGWLVALLALFWASPAAAGTSSDGALWAIVGAEQPIVDRLSAGLEVQTRAVDDMGELDRVVVRPSLSYRLLDSLTGTLGYDAHIVKLGRDRLEQRVWQQLSAGRDFGELGAGLRLRLEQRVFERISGAHVRLRAKLGLRYPVFDSGLSWIGANEVILGLNGLSPGPASGFNENRLFGGIGGPVGQRLSWEGGYQMRYLEARGPDAIQHALLLVLRYRGTR